MPQIRDNKERKLNMYTNMKTSNKKKLWLKAPVNSRCIYTGINKQLIKEE